jgi:hypothetical protein
MTLRVLEELCMDDACRREDTHWHPFSVASFLREKPGEYTVTLRVRAITKRKKPQDRPGREGLGAKVSPEDWRLIGFLAHAVEQVQALRGKLPRKHEKAAEEGDAAHLLHLGVFADSESQGADHEHDERDEDEDHAHPFACHVPKLAHKRKKGREAEPRRERTSRPIG